MNRQQLVDAVGQQIGDRRTAAVAVDAVLDTVTAALADGERVSLFGFGVFEKVERAARTARNPATGGTVEVPATAVPRFRAGQGLKDAVNGRPTRPRRSTPSADTTPGSRAGQRREAAGTVSKEPASKGKAATSSKEKGKNKSKSKEKKDTGKKGKTKKGKGT